VKIGRLDAGHVDRVTALESEVFSGRDPWPRTAFDAELRNPNAVWFVAVEGDAVVGYGGGWCVTPEFHLLNLAVHPDFRRRGLARELLEAVFSEGVRRNCGTVVLEVRHDNADAVRLYERLGFVRISSRARYYSAGEDALVYMRYP